MSMLHLGATLPAEQGAPTAPVAGQRTIGIEVFDSMAAAAGEWVGFEQQAACTVFQTFGRLAHWQKHVGSANGTAAVIVVGRGIDRKIAFLLPLGIEKRHGIRVLSWLGGGLSDYNAPLVQPGLAFPAGGFAGVWRQVLARLRSERRFAFDLIDLSKMPARIGETDNPFLQLKVMENPNRAYATKLGPDWPAFHAAKRSSGTRKRERNHLKQLAGFGAVEFRTIEDAVGIAATIDGMLGQKAASFRRMGVPDVFDRPGVHEFLHGWASDPAARPIVHVARLDVGSVMAAASVGLMFRGCYALVASSYHDGEMSRFGPGRAHLHRLLQYAIEAGYQTFDFTIGEEPYKRDWSDERTTLYEHVEGATLAGLVMAGAMIGQRVAKRRIKQSPALWRLAQRLRAARTRLSKPSTSGKADPATGE